MAFRFRRQIGPKGLKLNISKRGISSTSLKIAKGITYNTKRGLTLGIPGTGINYNFGKKKAQKPSMSPEEMQAIREQSLERLKTKAKKRREYNKGWREFTGGYSKKAMIAAGVCFISCLTPIWPLGLLLLIPSLIWFISDTSIKMLKYNKHLKEVGRNNTI